VDLRPHMVRPNAQARGSAPRRIASLVLLLSVRLWSQTPAVSPFNLMPMPAVVRAHEGRARIDRTLTVSIAGASDDRLRAAVARLLVRLQGRTGLVLSHDLASSPTQSSVVITARTPGPAVPALGEDESYVIDVDRQVSLESPTSTGALRGLETLLQLVSGDRDGFYFPGVHVEDRPRFPWRGLLIDVGRHFEPVDVIKRELDGMAAVKLNVLHWHLSEDQGFRVESRKFPKLQELGSDGLFYTQEQIRDVIEYARMRAIRVVPEFDMPGHVMSWVVGYPELASAPGPFAIARKAGVFDAVFDPTRSETYHFIDTFVGEISRLFPDPYWHVGGDENNGKQWQANPKIQAFMHAHSLKDVAALQTYFNQQLVGILEKHGKRMMGWDEILQPGLPKSAVIQSWRGERSLVDAARQGYDGVLSAGYYIDLLNTAASHYAVDPLPATTDLAAADAAHVLGGEATMWGEWVGPETLDSRIWPRTAAIAERFWSAREVANVDDMYRRLDVVSVQLEDFGITHLRNHDVLLRRLAAGADIGALQTLADVVEPVKGYQRGGQQPGMTTLGPLTHLVDAVTVDSPGARNIATLVDHVLSDAPRFGLGREELQHAFTSWRDNRAAFARLADQAPALAEATPLSDDLAEMGAIGLDALSCLSRGITPDAAWRDARLATLAQIARPKAALEFPFVAAMRELVVAASDQAALSTMSTAEWRTRVRSTASPPRRGRGGLE
jgi:hexosaminidase